MKTHATREYWKSVREAPGYEVSSLGRVRSVDRYVRHKAIGSLALRKGVILRLRSDKDGYLLVTLSTDCKARTFKVHRLVARAFITNPDNLPETNHRDLNKSNNTVSNLEWSTRQDNVTHFIDAVCTLNKRGSTIEARAKGRATLFFRSISEAERFGFHRGAIHACLNGSKDIYRGYVWSSAQ